MLVCNLAALRSFQLNSRQYNTAHKWGGFFRFYMFLIKVLNNIGWLYLLMRKNFTRLPRKQNDKTSVLWRVQYFNGDKNSLCCYWPEFSFSFNDEEMDTSNDSGSSPTNQPVVPFALGQVKILFTTPSHAEHLLTSNIQNNDLTNIFHWHKR